MIVYFSNLIRPVDHTFPTVCLECTVVCRGSFVTQNTRVDYVDQHIVTLLPEDFCRTRQAVAQESEIKTNIVVMDAFPCTVGTRQLTVSIYIRDFPLPINAPPLGVKLYNCAPS